MISFAKLRGYNEANIRQRILEVANEGQWLHTIGTIYRNFKDYMDSVFDSDEVRRHPTKMERVLNDYFNLISTAMAMIQRAVTTDLKSHANFKDLVFR